tara:strand:+ start:367 stop:645 length:279 start_codon:yes stop_codon:yes gene_type:complete
MGWSFADLKKKPLVLVTWQDITSTHCGWFERTDNLETATIKSPGWIVENNEDDVKMVSAIGWHGEESFLGFDTVLPKGCIEKITILRRRWWV